MIRLGGPVFRLYKHKVARRWVLKIGKWVWWLTAKRK